MLKLAFLKEEPNKVFLIDRVERVAISDVGVKECYLGTLVDTSTKPDTHVENYLVQVKGFESDWVDVPVDLSSVYNLNNQEKTVTPKKTKFTVKPDAGYTGLDSVTVNATPTESKTVTPGTADQEIVPTGEGKIALSKVTVTGDADLVAANIKEGVNLFGVEGTCVELDLSDFYPTTISDWGVGSDTISGQPKWNDLIKKIHRYTTGSGSVRNFFRAFKGDEIDGRGITPTSGDLYQCFYACGNLKRVDISTWDLGYVSMERGFSGCRSLEYLDMRNMDFSSSTQAGLNQAFTNVPNNCYIIVKNQGSIDAIHQYFSNLTNMHTKDEVEQTQ